MTKTASLNDKLRTIEEKLVDEFLLNLKDGAKEAANDLIETLQTYLDQESISVLNTILQRVLIRVALMISQNEVTGAAMWLHMNRTTLQEKAKAFGIRMPTIVPAKNNPRKINRHLGVLYPRKCSRCKTIFKGDYRTACPKCKNVDRRTIKVHYPKMK